MSDQSSLSKTLQSGGRLIAAQMAVALLGILATSFLARTVSKEALALVPVAATLGVLVQLVNNVGLPTACVRLIPELLAKSDYDRAGAVARSTLRVQLVVTLPLLGLVFILADWIALVLLKSPEAGPKIVQMLPFVLLLSMSQTLGLIMQGTGGFSRLSTGLLISNLAQQMGIPLAYLLWGMSGVLLVALPIGPLLQIILFSRALARLICKGRSFYPLFPLLKFALPFYGFSFLRYFGTGADLFLVVVLFPPDQVATYYVASRLSQALLSLLNNLNTPLMPQIAHTKTAGIPALGDLFTSVTRYFGYITIPICLGTAVMAHPLIHIVGGSSYQEAAWILVVQVFGVFAYEVYSIYAMNLFYLGEPVIQLKLQALNGFLSTALEAILGLALGIVGFAVGNLLGYVGSILYAVKLVQKYVHLHVDWRAVGQVSSGTVVLVAFAAIPQMLRWGDLCTWLLAGIGALFFSLLFLCKLEAADLQVFRGVVPGQIHPFLSKGTRALRAAYDKLIES